MFYSGVRFKINVEMRYLLFRNSSTILLTISSPEFGLLLSTNMLWLRLSSPHSVSMSSIDGVKTQPLTRSDRNYIIIGTWYMKIPPFISCLIWGFYPDGVYDVTVSLKEIFDVRLTSAVTDQPHWEPEGYRVGTVYFSIWKKRNLLASYLSSAALQKYV